MSDVRSNETPSATRLGGSTARPTLSWFPVRHIAGLLSGDQSLESVLDEAVEFEFSHVELHHATFDIRAKGLIEERGLALSQITCAPDFTHPDESVRRSEAEQMLTLIQLASDLASPNVRVTAGKQHAATRRDVGVGWAAMELSTLAETAAPLGVTLCLENHYRDRAWASDDLDFAAAPDIFMALYRALAGSKVMINFDTGQPMVVGGDDLLMLSNVLPKVRNVHVGDRGRGERSHSVLGEGQARLSELLAMLASAGYARFLTVEDGSREGAAGLRRGLGFLNGLVDRHWGERS